MNCSWCGATDSVWEDNLYWGCRQCSAGNILTANYRPQNNGPR